MKCTEIILAGRGLCLMYNGEAMFSIREKYGSADELLKKLAGDDNDSHDSLCDAVAILAEQGELVRRYMGYDSRPILTKDEIKRLIMPPDILSLKLAVPRAILLGLGREIEPENGEVDLVLAEINQKKTH